jgi:hypothetical protein
MVVFFPSRGQSAGESGGGSSVAKKVLDANRIGYLDLTGCVGTVSPGERFVALHYSARTNAAVAGCLRDAIAAGFESSSAGAGSPSSSSSHPFSFIRTEPS